VTATIGSASVVGHAEWKVDFGKVPQTPANTVTSAAETTRDGVRGTLYQMGNGDTMFMPQGPADYSILYERDNSTGRSTRTIYDQNGNYVITIDSDLRSGHRLAYFGSNNAAATPRGGIHRPARWRHPDHRWPGRTPARAFVHGHLQPRHW
jgi:hypothetical protein